MEKIKIVIVDDHPLMRQALQFAIEAEADMSVVGQAAHGVEALQVIAACQPDVILLDLLMPQMDGTQVIARLATWPSSPKILVVTSVEEQDQIFQTLSMGASGYVTKNADRAEIVAAIRVVYAGDAYLPPRIAARLMDVVRKNAGRESATPSVPALTQRERMVLDLAGQGQSDQQIALALGIKKVTVRVHLLHIMDKLGFDHRQQLVAYAARQRRV